MRILISAVIFLATWAQAAAPSPNISVTDYGAVPDSGSDATAAIQAAIDAALKGSVKVVVFPPGQYMVTSVNIAPGLTLWGYGATLKFAAMQGKWIRMLDTEKKGYIYSGSADSQPLVIKGFIFDGNRLSQGPYKNYELEHQAEIFLTADPKSTGRLAVTLEDITFQEGAGDGVDVFRNVNVKMNRIQAINLFREGIGIGGGNDIVNIDTFTSSGDDEYTGFHVEMSPGAGPNVITASHFRLQRNFSPGLINGSTLIATDITSGSPWSVAAADSSHVRIADSTLGGGAGIENRSNILFPNDIEFDNVDFYADDLASPPPGGLEAVFRVMTNNARTSYNNQRLHLRNCRFHLPRTGKPAWPLAAINDGGDQGARDNRIMLENCRVDSGFTYGLYGKRGGIWEVKDSAILADTPRFSGQRR